MKYFHRRALHGSFYDNNPMTGVANLFDLGLVFMVGLLLALLGALGLDDLLRENSTMTITRQSNSGEMEIIVKQGKKVESMKVTTEKSQGRGKRLGVAYQLDDGSFIYVPENDFQQ